MFVHAYASIPLTFHPCIGALSKHFRNPFFRSPLCPPLPFLFQTTNLLHPSFASNHPFWFKYITRCHRPGVFVCFCMFWTYISSRSTYQPCLFWLIFFSSSSQLFEAILEGLWVRFFSILRFPILDHRFLDCRNSLFFLKFDFLALDYCNESSNIFALLQSS